MNMKFMVKYNNAFISFLEAIRNGCVSIEEDGLEEKEKTRLLLFSGLYDDNNEEIYDGDTLTDDSNRNYIVCFKLGSFYATRESPNGEREEIPLLLLQSHGKVPAKKQTNY